MKPGFLTLLTALFLSTTAGAETVSLENEHYRVTVSETIPSPRAGNDCRRWTGAALLTLRSPLARMQNS